MEEGNSEVIIEKVSLPFLTQIFLAATQENL